MFQLTSGQVSGGGEECVFSDSKTAGQVAKANLTIDPNNCLLMPVQQARQKKFVPHPSPGASDNTPI